MADRLKYVFGITGPTGAGKSTVSGLLRKKGIYVADADKAARRVTAKDMPCLAELKAEFGTGIISADGTLNRAGLAGIVFSDKNKLKLLNGITHKYIKEYIELELAAAESEIAAIDGAVIIGSPVEHLCRCIVLVTADKAVRAERIMQRDSIDCAAAQARIAAQPDDDYYIKHAEYVIVNNARDELLGEQVEQLYKKIKLAAENKQA